MSGIPGSELKYIDFVPKQTKAPGLVRQGEYEDFNAAVQAANEWLHQHPVQLLNFETVVLPNMWKQWEEGSVDASLSTSGDSPSQWHQFLRCWYRDIVPAGT